MDMKAQLEHALDILCQLCETYEHAPNQVDNIYVHAKQFLDELGIRPSALGHYAFQTTNK